jgi:hypothetical protein
MQKLNETEFKQLVEKLLSGKNVKFRDIQSSDRKTTGLSQKLFFTLTRRHGSHIPDLLLQSEETGPCELKSPKEIYDVCHYSRAHLVSYLYQTIYGQCVSYADLFRGDDKLPLKIHLIIPERILIKSDCFCSIESTFSSVLEDPQELIRKEMELSKICFPPPPFSRLDNDKKYGTLGTEDDTIIITKIEYEPNKWMLRTP